MRVSLFESRDFEVRWPEEFPKGGTLTEKDQIVFNCTRLDHKTRRSIENSMVKYRPGDFQRDRPGKKKQRSVDDVSMNLAIGDIKDLKLKAVTDWSNVLDSEGDIIPFSSEKLQELIATNAGVSITEYGSLEEALLDAINDKCNFVDQEKTENPN